MNSSLRTYYKEKHAKLVSKLSKAPDRQYNMTQSPSEREFQRRKKLILRIKNHVGTVAELKWNKKQYSKIERSESVERLIKNNSLGYEESLAHVVNEY